MRVVSQAWYERVFSSQHFDHWQNCSILATQIRAESKQCWFARGIRFVSMQQNCDCCEWNGFQGVFGYFFCLSSHRKYSLKNEGGIYAPTFVCYDLFVFFSFIFFLFFVCSIWQSQDNRDQKRFPQPTNFFFHHKTMVFMFFVTFAHWCY